MGKQKVITFTENTFTKKEFFNFIGEKKGRRFYEELTKLQKITDEKSIDNLEIMNKINSEYNPEFKNDGVTYDYNDVKFEESMIRYKRIDNNKVVAYIFAFTDEDIN